MTSRIRLPNAGYGLKIATDSLAISPAFWSCRKAKKTKLSLLAQGQELKVSSKLQKAFCRHALYLAGVRIVMPKLCLRKAETCGFMHDATKLIGTVSTSLSWGLPAKRKKNPMFSRGCRVCWRRCFSGSAWLKLTVLALLHSLSCAGCGQGLPA